jgi:hypothetical protein
MAKAAITADQLDTILSTILAKTLPEIMHKTLEQFENQIDRFIARVEARFDEKVEKIYGELFLANSRIDALETKLAQLETAQHTQQVIMTSPAKQSAASLPAIDMAGIIEATSQALIAVEKEKEEIKLRSSNVIVSGIGSSSTVSDKELLESFCENYLTIKPRVVRARRIGKDKAKLCITLESAEAVDDLIDSSSLLRNASDHNARHTYFNRDQTKQQAQAAYNKRCLA